MHLSPKHLTAALLTAAAIPVAAGAVHPATSAASVAAHPAAATSSGAAAPAITTPGAAAHPATANAAGKRGAPTGIFAGSAVHPFQLETPYSTRIVLQVSRKNGAVRLTGITLSVRMECPEEQAIQDRQIFKTYFDGPKIGAGGRFTYKHGGIRVQGTIGRAGAEGTIDASERGCRVSGVTWTASKRKGS